MNSRFPALSWPKLPGRARGMFNLNDPRWGRSDDEPQGAARPESDGSEPPAPAPPPPAAPVPSRERRPDGSHQGPPDLDELWREFNRKLSGLFGGKRNQGGGAGGGGGGRGFPPEFKNARLGIGMILGAVVLIWLASGFFIVQEGQQAVITQFGRYKSTVGAGINWRLPYPIQRAELVFVTQIRSLDIGRDTIIKATGLRESAMLTRDENIVEIKFAVQYRLNDARAYLFNSKDPSASVVQAAESSIREVIGKMTMDSALAEERDQIAPRVRKLMQSILDRYDVGIEIVGINLQQGGVRPPEQVQAAFDDVLKAGQERERAKNDAQAYANDVIPRAVGAASRLKEEADAYKAKIVAQAQGDSQRFSSVLAEYEKAPGVTRDRMYLDTMQDIYSSVPKVLIDSRSGSNLLYLPIDKLLQGAKAAPDASKAAVNDGGTDPAAPKTASSGSASSSVPPPFSSESTRARDNGRSRERESR
jgi:membrane protease subunit HflK